MMIRSALRFLLVAGACSAGLSLTVAHAEVSAQSSLPPVYPCYTLSTNPPTGPYKPEVTVCVPR